MRLLILLLLTLAAGPSPADLAPGPVELDGALTALETQLDAAEAIGTALARVHNALAEQALIPGKASCEAPAVALAARTPALGAALRDAAQSARVAEDRVARIAQAPTAAPIAQGPMAERIATDAARLDAALRRYQETSAWQASYVNPLLRRCKPALVAAEGLGEPGTGLVAVVATGGGRVCPMDLPAEGVVLLPKGEACLGAVGCGCTPAPQLPGAVLGP